MEPGPDGHRGLFVELTALTLEDVHATNPLQVMVVDLVRGEISPKRIVQVVCAMVSYILNFMYFSLCKKVILHEKTNFKIASDISTSVIFFLGT